VLAAARASTPRSQEARWVVLDPTASLELASGGLPRSSITLAGPMKLRCVSLVHASGTESTALPCLPVTLPVLPPDFQDPVDRGTAMGAWLLAEIVRNDSLAPAGRVQ
jgi:hypothetical protein